MIKGKVIAEGLGTLGLVCTVVGSGIMAETLSAGNDGIALLGNTIATGAMLVVLITLFGPVSGAHFNPVVTMVMALKKQLPKSEAAIYIIVQILGGIAGTWLAHLMFDVPVLQLSDNARSGLPQYGSEIVATFGLLLTILIASRHRPDSIAMLVGLYITAAYWFTSSTSFANPAVTIARSLTDSFAGIAYSDVPFFILAQIIGALLAMFIASQILSSSD